MTIEYREKSGTGRGTKVVTTACGLCEEPLRERQGMADHLPKCPVREIYAERGALLDGGPDPARVRAILASHGTGEPAPQVATDGGDPSWE